MSWFLELTRVVAYGGIGILIGYIVGHEVALHDYAVKHSGEEPKPMPESRMHRRLAAGVKRLPSTETWQRAGVLLAMVALLLTGIAVLKQRANDAADLEQRCRDLRQVVATIEARAEPAAQAADLNDELWVGVRRVLLSLGGTTDSPLIHQIDHYLEKRADAKRAQQRNPISTDILEGC